MWPSSLKFMKISQCLGFCIAGESKQMLEQTTSLYTDTVICFQDITLTNTHMFIHMKIPFEPKTKQNSVQERKMKTAGIPTVTRFSSMENSNLLANSSSSLLFSLE